MARDIIPGYIFFRLNQLFIAAVNFIPIERILYETDWSLRSHGYRRPHHWR